MHLFLYFLRAVLGYMQVMVLGGDFGYLLLSNLDKQHLWEEKDYNECKLFPYSKETLFLSCSMWKVPYFFLWFAFFFVSICCGKRKEYILHKNFNTSYATEAGWMSVNILITAYSSRQTSENTLIMALQLQALKQLNIQVVRRMLKRSKSHPAGICFS